MEFYSVKDIAKKIGKSERTIYRLLLKESIHLNDCTIEGKTKLYSKNVLNLLAGETPIEQRENSGKVNNIDSLEREIETLKFANDQLSRYTQKAFDSLQREQENTKQLTESLKASQSLQLVAEQRAKELESKINLLESGAPVKSKKKKKKKKGKKLF